MRSMAENASLNTIAEDFIFFDRTLYGLLKIFERLEAKVFFRKNWQGYWDAL